VICTLQVSGIYEFYFNGSVHYTFYIASLISQTSLIPVTCTKSTRPSFLLQFPSHTSNICPCRLFIFIISHQPGFRRDLSNLRTHSFLPRILSSCPKIKMVRRSPLWWETLPCLRESAPVESDELKVHPLPFFFFTGGPPQTCTPPFYFLVLVLGSVSACFK